MIRLKLKFKKNSKLLNLNFFLITLLLSIHLLSGCSVRSESINLGEKIEKGVML